MKKLICILLILCLAFALSANVLAAEFANAYTLLQDWEENGYPDDVGSIYSTDGTPYNFTVQLVGDDIEARADEIRASYELLGLISFLTGGGDECRAWTIRKGTKAPQAAGKIHTDFERGFIRAEVIAFDDLKACGTLQAARAKGLVRSEGKEYVMRDGDVVNFLFNV